MQMFIFQMFASMMNLIALVLLYIHTVYYNVLTFLLQIFWTCFHTTLD